MANGTTLFGPRPDWTLSPADDQDRSDRDGYATQAKRLRANLTASLDPSNGLDVGTQPDASPPSTIPTTAVPGWDDQVRALRERIFGATTAPNPTGLSVPPAPGVTMPASQPDQSGLSIPPASAQSWASLGDYQRPAPPAQESGTGVGALTAFAPDQASKPWWIDPSSGGVQAPQATEAGPRISDVLGTALSRATTTAPNAWATPDRASGLSVPPGPAASWYDAPGLEKTQANGNQGSLADFERQSGQPINPLAAGLGGLYAATVANDQAQRATGNDASTWLAGNAGDATVTPEVEQQLRARGLNDNEVAVARRAASVLLTARNAPYQIRHGGSEVVEGTRDAVANGDLGGGALRAASGFGSIMMGVGAIAAPLENLAIMGASELAGGLAELTTGSRAFGDGVATVFMAAQMLPAFRRVVSAGGRGLGAAIDALRAESATATGRQRIDEAVARLTGRTLEDVAQAMFAGDETTARLASEINLDPARLLETLTREGSQGATPLLRNQVWQEGFKRAAEAALNIGAAGGGAIAGGRAGYDQSVQAGNDPMSGATTFASVMGATSGAMHALIGAHGTMAAGRLVSGAGQTAYRGGRDVAGRVRDAVADRTNQTPEASRTLTGEETPRATDRDWSLAPSTDAGDALGGMSGRPRDNEETVSYPAPSPDVDLGLPNQGRFGGPDGELRNVWENAQAHPNVDAPLDVRTPDEASAGKFNPNEREWKASIEQAAPASVPTRFPTLEEAKALTTAPTTDGLVGPDPSGDMAPETVSQAYNELAQRGDWVLDTAPDGAQEWRQVTTPDTEIEVPAGAETYRSPDGYYRVAWQDGDVRREFIRVNLARKGDLGSEPVTKSKKAPALWMPLNVDESGDRVRVLAGADAPNPNVRTRNVSAPETVTLQPGDFIVQRYWDNKNGVWRKRQVPPQGVLVPTPVTLAPGSIEQRLPSGMSLYLPAESLAGEGQQTQTYYMRVRRGVADDGSAGPIDFIRRAVLDYRGMRDPVSGKTFAEWYPDFGAIFRGLLDAEQANQLPPQARDALMNLFGATWGATTAGSTPEHNMFKTLLHLANLSEWFRARETWWRGLKDEVVPGTNVLIKDAIKPSLFRLPTGAELKTMAVDGVIDVLVAPNGQGGYAEVASASSSIKTGEALAGERPLLLNKTAIFGSSGLARGTVSRALGYTGETDGKAEHKRWLQAPIADGQKASEFVARLNEQAQSSLAYARRTGVASDEFVNATDAIARAVNAPPATPQALVDLAGAWFDAIKKARADTKARAGAWTRFAVDSETGLTDTTQFMRNSGRMFENKRVANASPDAQAVASLTGPSKGGRNAWQASSWVRRRGIEEEADSDAPVAGEVFVDEEGNKEVADVGMGGQWGVNEAESITKFVQQLGRDVGNNLKSANFGLQTIMAGLGHLIPGSVIDVHMFGLWGFDPRYTTKRTIDWLEKQDAKAKEDPSIAGRLSAYGPKGPASITTNKVQSSINAYLLVQEAVRQVAREAGLSEDAAQAVLWFVAKNEVSTGPWTLDTLDRDIVVPSRLKGGEVKVRATRPDGTPMRVVGGTAEATLQAIGSGLPPERSLLDWFKEAGYTPQSTGYDGETAQSRLAWLLSTPDLWRFDPVTGTYATTDKGERITRASAVEAMAGKRPGWARRTEGGTYEGFAHSAQRGGVTSASEAQRRRTESEIASLRRGNADLEVDDADEADKEKGRQAGVSALYYRDQQRARTMTGPSVTVPLTREQVDKLISDGALERKPSVAGFDAYDQDPAQASRNPVDYYQFRALGPDAVEQPAAHRAYVVTDDAGAVTGLRVEGVDNRTPLDVGTIGSRLYRALDDSLGADWSRDGGPIQVTQTLTPESRAEPTGRAVVLQSASPSSEGASRLALALERALRDANVDASVMTSPVGDAVTVTPRNPASRDALAIADRITTVARTVVGNDPGLRADAWQLTGDAAVSSASIDRTEAQRVGAESMARARGEVSLTDTQRQAINDAGARAPQPVESEVGGYDAGSTRVIRVGDVATVQYGGSDSEATPVVSADVARGYAQTRGARVVARATSQAGELVHTLVRDALPDIDTSDLGLGPIDIGEAMPTVAIDLGATAFGHNSMRAGDDAIVSVNVPLLTRMGQLLEQGVAIGRRIIRLEPGNGHAVTADATIHTLVHEALHLAGIPDSAQFDTLVERVVDRLFQPDMRARLDPARRTVMRALREADNDVAYRQASEAIRRDIDGWLNDRRTRSGDRGADAGVGDAGTQGWLGESGLAFVDRQRGRFGDTRGVSGGGGGEVAGAAGGTSRADVGTGDGAGQRRVGSGRRSGARESAGNPDAGAGIGEATGLAGSGAGTRASRGRGAGARGVRDAGAGEAGPLAGSATGTELGAGEPSASRSLVPDVSYLRLPDQDGDVSASYARRDRAPASQSLLVAEAFPANGSGVPVRLYDAGPSLRELAGRIQRAPWAPSYVRTLESTNRYWAEYLTRLGMIPRTPADWRRSARSFDANELIYDHAYAQGKSLRRYETATTPEEFARTTGIQVEGQDDAYPDQGIRPGVAGGIAVTHRKFGEALQGRDAVDMGVPRLADRDEQERANPGVPPGYLPRETMIVANPLAVLRHMDAIDARRLDEGNSALTHEQRRTLFGWAHAMLTLHEQVHMAGPLHGSNTLVRFEQLVEDLVPGTPSGRGAPASTDRNAVALPVNQSNMGAAPVVRSWMREYDHMIDNGILDDVVAFHRARTDAYTDVEPDTARLTETRMTRRLAPNLGPSFPGRPNRPELHDPEGNEVATEDLPLPGGRSDQPGYAEDLPAASRSLGRAPQRVVTWGLGSAGGTRSGREGIDDNRAIARPGPLSRNELARQVRRLKAIGYDAQTRRIGILNDMGIDHQVALNNLGSWESDGRIDHEPNVHVVVSPAADPVAVAGAAAIMGVIDHQDAMAVRAPASNLPYDTTIAVRVPADGAGTGRAIEAFARRYPSLVDPAQLDQPSMGMSNLPWETSSDKRWLTLSNYDASPSDVAGAIRWRDELLDMLTRAGVAQRDVMAVPHDFDYIDNATYGRRIDAYNQAVAAGQLAVPAWVRTGADERARGSALGSERSGVSQSWLRDQVRRTASAWEADGYTFAWRNPADNEAHLDADFAGMGLDTLPAASRSLGRAPGNRGLEDADWNMSRFPELVRKGVISESGMGEVQDYITRVSNTLVPSSRGRQRLGLTEQQREAARNDEARARQTVRRSMEELLADRINTLFGQGAIDPANMGLGNVPDASGAELDALATRHFGRSDASVKDLVRAAEESLREITAIDPTWMTDGALVSASLRAQNALRDRESNQVIRSELADRAVKRVTQLRYAAMLSGTKGMAEDVVSNLLNLGLTVAREPVQAAIEKALRVPRENRVASWDTATRATWAGLTGAVTEAVKEAVHVMWTGGEPVKHEQPKTLIPGPLGMPIEFALRGRTAADVLVHTLGTGIAIERIASREAQRRGYRPGTPEFRGTVRDVRRSLSRNLNKPNPDPAIEPLVAEAKRDAASVVFQDPFRAPFGVGELRQDLPETKLWNLLIPFYRTTANIAVLGADMMPGLGQAGLLLDAANAVVRGKGPYAPPNVGIPGTDTKPTEPGEPRPAPYLKDEGDRVVTYSSRQVAEGVPDRSTRGHWATRTYDERVRIPAWRLANQTLGVAIMGLGAMLGVGGLMTGAGPADDSQKKALEKDGWQPFAWINGSNFVDFGKITGGAQLPLMAGAGIAEVWRRTGEAPPEALVQALGSELGRWLTSNAGLDSMAQAVDWVRGSLQGDKTVTPRTGASYAMSLIPYSGLLRQVAKALDPYDRESATFLEYMMQGIPGLRERLPTKQDELGRSWERPSGQTGVRTMLPFQSSTDTTGGRHPYRFAASRSYYDDARISDAVSAGRRARAGDTSSLESWMLPYMDATEQASYRDMASSAKARSAAEARARR